MPQPPEANSDSLHRPQLPSVADAGPMQCRPRGMIASQLFQLLSQFPLSRRLIGAERQLETAGSAEVISALPAERG